MKKGKKQEKSKAGSTPKDGPDSAWEATLQVSKAQKKAAKKNIDFENIQFETNEERSTNIIGKLILTSQAQIQQNSFKA